MKPLRTGEITGVEALIRWQHPTLGPASPSEFIPIANETDLMFDLDAWVIDEACRRFTEW
ncbi:MAG: EAL domain-containing protein [Planctomycetaceae bacterium]|nr:EAL domain-containing protein [Planctomycetaceae bacterium]